MWSVSKECSSHYSTLVHPVCCFDLQAESRTAEEKVGMFSNLLKITQTDQLLKNYHLDLPGYLELSVQGASLIMTLYKELPVSTKQPSE